MTGLRIYFSDFFGVDADLVESYGAVNISLINDLPLFVDPFLLFNSEKEEYQNIHNEIIRYLLFLQEQAEKYEVSPPGMFLSWYLFSEIKQTWLGFSLAGNSGRGLGNNFAKNLHHGLRTIFSDFGKETVTKSSHLEKLCLISPLVGRDKISDFTTNFTKRYILEYTEKFAKEYLEEPQCQKFNIPKVGFNYETHTWITHEYFLPCHNGDYVLLTPRDMLTRDETFINRNDMIGNLQNIAPAIEDAGLRFQLNQYLTEILPKKKKEMSKTDKERAATSLIQNNPEIIDYYIKYKEENMDQATSISKQVVEEVKILFNTQLQELARMLYERTDFYEESSSSYEEAYKRVLYLKKVIEDMDGYRIFYLNGKPIKRESDLQIMYRLVWYATEFDVNREVNNGRGPVDFKVSKGSIDSSLIEFKLASNSKLKKNIQNQVEVYKKANCTDRAIKVIMFFTDGEQSKLYALLNELGLAGCKDIVLIDARDDKVSASNA
ncbi:MAG: hypothetical protein PHV32_07130 [Eubacteriales bacterium]|nr:hypothetical protein [Eubacteriales bacterium]